MNENEENQTGTDNALLLFAIKMATLPFWAEIKNLRKFEQSY